MSDETTNRSSEVLDRALTMSQKVPECPNGGGERAATDAQVPAGLTDAQLRAIESLIAGTSVSKTAEECGVDRRTIYRWRHECEPFRAELAQRRREMWTGAADRMRALVHTSLHVLRKQLQVEWENTSFRAASTVLRLANVRKLLEAEMVDRDE